MMEVGKRKLVKTRKENECHGCANKIEKGIHAVCVTGKEDEKHFRIHLHLECNKQATKHKLFEQGFVRGVLKESTESAVNTLTDFSIAKTDCPF